MTCAASGRCPREEVTQHFKKAGHGTVSSDENVIFVVFDGNVALGERLNRKHFDTRKIKDGDLSLARQKYTTIDDLNTFVIVPATQSGCVLNGAVIAEVHMLRSIVKTQAPAGPLRGVCVIDKVEEGEHNGHAALMACADQAASFTNPQSLGKFRGQIALDLADKFSEVRAIDAVGLAASIASPGEVAPAQN
jgi:hypothetical protein